MFRLLMAPLKMLILSNPRANLKFDHLSLSVSYFEFYKYLHKVIKRFHLPTPH